MATQPVDNVKRVFRTRIGARERVEASLRSWLEPRPCSVPSAIEHASTDQDERFLIEG